MSRMQSLKSGVAVAVLAGGVLLAGGTLLASSAQAADFGMLPVASTGGWEGLYFGGHLGGSGGDISGLGGIVGVNATDRMSGFSGGLLGGWNAQFDQWVFGIEADAGLSAVKGDIVILGVNVTEDVVWNGNLRARMGYLLTPDILAYAAGGLAVADFDINTSSAVAGNDEAVFLGWTLGAGIEARLTGHLRGRLEYLYTDYGSERMFATVGGVNVSPESHAVRAALVYDLGALMP